jgi:hypothetical protein
MRLCLEAFRDAPESLSATDIIAAVIATKGFDTGDRELQAAIGELVKATLAPIRQRGVVEKIGAGRGRPVEAQGTGAGLSLEARNLKLTKPAHPSRRDQKALRCLRPHGLILLGGCAFWRRLSTGTRQTVKARQAGSGSWGSDFRNDAQHSSVRLIDCNNSIRNSC